ncbi:MAG: AAA family ATPase [Rectinema subterraneum]|uniref:AAA family ATPase n=1 Tax=Rectinema subterraneum TaxID=2653714 RepID=UPI003C7D73E4
MRPIRLAFEHFGPYAERQDIDFSALEDFFLIYGKTGSGKTTIFDAIAYALYGEAIGGRSNLEREFASRFSSQGSKPWVEFEFSASSAQWKVYRSVPYKKQNRKGKESEAAAEAALYRMNEASKSYELVADRITPVNEALLDLLRLRADEFSKIVLLPQGEFQEFLEMKTSDRAAILEKLFDVRMYEKATEMARRKVDLLSSSLSAKNDELERLASELGSDPLARIEAMRKAFEGFRAQIEETKENASHLDTEIAQINERIELWQAFMSARAAFIELEHSKPSFEARAASLDAAKNLATLAGLAQSVRSQHEDFLVVLKEAQRAGTELTKLEKARLEVERDKERLPGLKNRQNELQRIAALYQRALDAWRRKEETARNLDELQKRISIALDSCAAREQELALTRKRISEFEALLAKEPEAQALTQNNAVAIEALKRAEVLAKQLERLNSQRAQILREIQSTEDSLLIASRDLASAEAARSRLEDAFRLAQAGILAAALEEGEPCPVCGSLHHPHPASLPNHAPDEQTVRQAQDVVETQKARHAGLAQKKESLAQRLQDIEHEIGSLQQSISEEWQNREELASFRSEAEEISSKAIEALAQSLKERKRILDVELEQYRLTRVALRTSRQQFEAAEEAFNQARQEREQLEKTKAELQARLDSLAEQAGEHDPEPLLENTLRALSDLQGEIIQLEQRAQEWQMAYRATSAQLDIHLSSLELKGNSLRHAFVRFFEESERLDVRALLRTLEQAGVAKDAALQTSVPQKIFIPEESPHEAPARAKPPSALDALSDLAGILSQTAKGNETADRKARVSRAASILSVAFRAAGQKEAEEEAEAEAEADVRAEAAALALVAHVEQASWPTDRLRSEEQAVSAFREAYARAKAAYDALAARARRLNEDAAKSFSDQEIESEEHALIDARDALVLRKKDLEDTLAELQRARAEIGAQLDQFKRSLERYNELQQQYSAATQEFGKMEKLSRLLSGDLIKGKKLPFKNYVLGAQFREIAARASERLYRMSSGRYIVEADPLSGTGNQKIGLELFITDAWNGARRPVGTLSGGEKFMLSISLALGLADSIQERAGANRIESLFIDEGFGSLDAESLSLAISVLDELRGDKTIAIISHVDELYSRIPSRIVVEKGVGGSRLRLERD